MAEQLDKQRQQGKRAGLPERRTLAVRREGLATVLRRSAQCLRIGSKSVGEGGAPTHRIIFTYRDGDDVPEAARRMSRAFGMGLAIVLSLRSARCLCRVFAVSGAHAQGVTSLHFTVSLREFGVESIRWRSRPGPARRGRAAWQPVGTTLPLPL